MDGKSSNSILTLSKRRPVERRNVMKDLSAHSITTTRIGALLMMKKNLKSTTWYSESSSQKWWSWILTTTSTTWGRWRIHLSRLKVKVIRTQKKKMRTKSSKTLSTLKPMTSFPRSSKALSQTLLSRRLSLFRFLCKLKSARQLLRPKVLQSPRLPKQSFQLLKKRVVIRAKICRTTQWLLRKSSYWFNLAPNKL